jgi:hypothetical protein
MVGPGDVGPGSVLRMDPTFVSDVHRGPARECGSGAVVPQSFDSRPKRPNGDVGLPMPSL